MSEPEFIRGNQKNYIRIACQEAWMEGYEYQMCMHNHLESILNFKPRTQNGANYLYYEVSGMQSLDILLQSQKLKRSLAVELAKAIIILCEEFSEHVLDIEKLIWNPKYLMYHMNNGELRFVYEFGAEEEKSRSSRLEPFLECLVEHLDYQDEILVSQVYQVYESLLDQKEQFHLLEEMKQLLHALEPQAERDRQENVMQTGEVTPQIYPEDPFEQNKMEQEIITVPEKSKVIEKQGKHLKKGLLILLLLDAGVLFVWQPLTILKIFFCVALGGVLLWLNAYVRRQEKRKKEKKKQEEQQAEYLEEYQNLTNMYDSEQGGTRMISLEEMGGALYNLQGGEPQCIYISETGKIIGKDAKKAQIMLSQEGISRVHAMVHREGRDCILEDLNSTNGTFVNGEALLPRQPYILKEGDKIHFAGTEYIFR